MMQLALLVAALSVVCVPSAENPIKPIEAERVLKPDNACCAVARKEPPRATCAEVCRNYEKLRCAAARETVDGDTCEDVCGRVMGSGIVEFDLECRARATSCEKADACED